MGGSGWWLAACWLALGPTDGAARAESEARSEPLAVQEPRALEGAIGLAWRARDGTVLVLCENGALIRTFDVLLRPSETRVQDPPMRGVRCVAGEFFFCDASGEVHDAEGRPVTLPEDLRPEPYAGGPLAIDGPAGRHWTLAPEEGVLRLGLSPWEHGGEVEWGPGRATVRMRSTLGLGPWLEWRRVLDDARRLAPVRIDARNAWIQRAFLEPLAAGDRIALRYRPPERRWPPADWSPWRELTVPAVDPAGERPVSVLPWP